MFSFADKVGSVVGIAVDRSSVWGCAEAFRSAGAEVAISCLDARAEPHVRACEAAVRYAAVELSCKGVTSDAPFAARNATGGVHHIDGGYSITG